MSEKLSWVLVETVSMHRMRYMVQVPTGSSHWARDTVTMEQALEFSQKHLGETIISHRVISEDDALSLSDEDNFYASEWDKETKMKNLFTFFEEE